MEIEEGKKKMSRSIQLDSDGNDITCMKEFDALKYSCRECDREGCGERENYDKRNLLGKINLVNNEEIIRTKSHN